MAKTTAAKAPSKSGTGSVSTVSRSTKSKSKRGASTAGNGAPGAVQPSSFPMPTGAFTVEQPPDPGPKRRRHSFAKIPHVLEIPNLIELQKASFEWFKTEGLAEAFASISPIKDFTGNLVLEFGEHSLGEPKYSVEECRERDMTYSAPLRVRVRLITAESGEIKGIPDQEIFMGDFPLMTDKGTFMVNGAERVIVSQLVRSPGVYYNQRRRHEQPAGLQRDDHSEPRRLDRIRNRQRHQERRNRRHHRRSHRQKPQDLRLDVHSGAFAPRARLRLGERRGDPGAVRFFAAGSQFDRQRQRHQDAGRRAQRDLQEAAPRRARKCRKRREAARIAVFRRQALRSGGRRTVQAEQQVRLPHRQSGSGSARRTAARLDQRISRCRFDHAACRADGKGRRRSRGRGRLVRQRASRAVAVQRNDPLQRRHYRNARSL